jgi:glycosyltransferase involved in cell wall biosynthesis
VDVTEIDAVTEPSAEIEPWRQAGDFVVGYIGQLIPRKGLLNLIRAFDALDTPRKRLCIVGDGPQRAELEAAAAASRTPDKIRFFGYRQDRIALLKSFDLFVLPSSLEGIPRCLLEAMAAGVAVAASDVPGCTDIVTPGSNGLLFPFGDEAALARVMESMTRHELRTQFAAAGRKLVVERYSAARMAQEYLELYRSLTAAPASAAGTPVRMEK